MCRRKRFGVVARLCAVGLLLTCGLAALHADPNSATWNSLHGKFRCEITANHKTLSFVAGQAPTSNAATKLQKHKLTSTLKPNLIIKLTIEYTDDRTVTVPWDNDLARLLWDQAFALELKSDQHTANSRFLRSTTGGVYGTRARVRMLKGTKLSATLDFSTVPAHYLATHLQHPGTTRLQLYLHLHAVTADTSASTPTQTPDVALCNAIHLRIQK